MLLRGKTGLHILMECDDDEIISGIDILIRVGAKTNIKSALGLTPVEEAFIFNKDKIVRYLKEKIITPHGTLY